MNPEDLRPGSDVDRLVGKEILHGELSEEGRWGFPSSDGKALEIRLRSFQPSTEIADAIEVAAKIAEHNQNYSPAVSILSVGDGWQVSILGSAFWDRSLAFAICVSALKAAGIVR